jgi:hypothetical protein
VLKLGLGIWGLVLLATKSIKNRIRISLIWLDIPQVGVSRILLNLMARVLAPRGTHVSQYLAQLGEAGSIEALRIQLFSLSLIGTTFAWFSSLPAYSIYGWEPLERKFYVHFYSGNSEAKLEDLTSVRQTRDESVLDYFK